MCFAYIIPGGTSTVSVRFGRPDIPAAVHVAFHSTVLGETFTVWSAGPKKMNEIVYVAANKLPLAADVRVFPMAYEL